MLGKANKQGRKPTKNDALGRLIKQIVEKSPGHWPSKRRLPSDTCVMIAIECLLPTVFFDLTDAGKKEHSL